MPLVNNSNKLTHLQRTLTALKMRVEGATLAQIAAEVDMTEPAVSSIISSRLKEIREITTWAAEDFRQLELERLDKLQRFLNEALDNGDMDAATLWLRLSESRRRLLGLDKPIEVNHYVDKLTDGELLEQARKLIFGREGNATDPSEEGVDVAIGGEPVSQ